MTAQTTQLTAPDGTALSVHEWTPEQPPVAVLHIAHGLAEHGLRYAPFARHMAAAGWVVRANDHRGHGAACPDEDLGFFAESDGWQTVVDDLRLHLDAARAAHPGLPVFLFAHSMGSLIAQSLLTRGEAAAGDLAGVVLSGTNGKPPLIATAGRVLARMERLRLGPRGRSPLIQALTFDDFNKAFAPTRTDFDWLSRDPDQVDAYIDDPRCGFSASVQLWIDLLDAIPDFTSDDAQLCMPVNLPVFLVAGDQDPVGEMGRSVTALGDDLERAGLTDVTVRLWPGARHELLNETCREEVVEAVAAWLEARRLAAG
jgi:alpha-beta hydrolase superfamily lysophospholipase